MSIYDAKNEDALKTQGWKSYKDSTLKSMNKDDLINQIRCLEHNWAGEIKANKLLSYRLKCFLDVLEKNGHPEKFNQICALPGEYGYRQDDLEPNLDLFCEGRDDYWYNSYLRAMRELKVYKEAIKDIESYSPCYYELDYDWDEEPIDNYQSLDIDYIIENVRENMKIDRDEENKKLFGIWDLNEMNYFTKEEQKAEEEIIKKMAVEPKDNFYDYYEKEEKENE